MMKHKPKKPYSGPRYNPEDWYKNLYDCEVIEEFEGYKIRMTVHITHKPPWSKEVEVTKHQVQFIDGNEKKRVCIPEYLCRRLGI